MADMEAGMFDVAPPVGAGPRSPAVADSQQARSRSPRRPASRRELHRLLSAASSEWDGEQDGPVVRFLLVPVMPTMRILSRVWRRTGQIQTVLPQCRASQVRLHFCGETRWWRSKCQQVRRRTMARHLLCHQWRHLFGLQTLSRRWVWKDASFQPQGDHPGPTQAMRAWL